MDSSSCYCQTARSHSAAEEIGSACHDDLLDSSLNLACISPRGPGAHWCPLNMPPELTISKRQQRRSIQKNVNTVATTRADHTTGGKGRDSSDSLVSPDEPRQDSISIRPPVAEISSGWNLGQFSVRSRRDYMFHLVLLTHLQHSAHKALSFFKVILNVRCLLFLYLASEIKKAFRSGR